MPHGHTGLFTERKNQQLANTECGQAQAQVVAFVWALQFQIAPGLLLQSWRGQGFSLPPFLCPTFLCNKKAKPDPFFQIAEDSSGTPFHS